MTKAELITAISDATGITKTDTSEFLDTLAKIGAKELTDTGEFSLPGFGKMAVDHRSARKGRNPRTGESVEIPASNRIKFSMSKVLKHVIN
jgi:DNA-binding protein HU-beta